MARVATNDSGVTSAEAAARVRSMDKYVQDTVAESEVASRNLAVMEEEARLYRFHAHLGGFSACVCDLLKMGEPSTPLLKAPWTTIVQALDKEDNNTAAWIASGCPARGAKTPYRDAICRRVQLLIGLGHNDVDTDIALFAVRAYARRNCIAHGASYGLDKSGDCAGLALDLDNVDKTLLAALHNQQGFDFTVYHLPVVQDPGPAFQELPCWPIYRTTGEEGRTSYSLSI